MDQIYHLKAKYFLIYINVKLSYFYKTIEEQKKRIIGLERMVLETSCFDFRQRHPQPYIIKFARHLKRSMIF